MQTIKAYYSLEQFEQMKDYLDHLEQDLDSIDIAIKTGNVSVDAILSSKLSLAKKKNIDVNVRAVVPASLPIKDVDLCVVLGNLIDNALDACDKMKETEQRFLRVYIGKYKQQLYLSVTNSTHEVKRRENRFLITDKYGNHGHGLRRIDTIVDQYGGYINRKNEPGVFVTEIILCTI